MDYSDGPIPDLTEIQNGLAERPDDVGLLEQFADLAATAAHRARERLTKAHADSARAHLVLAEGFAEGHKISEAVREYAAALAREPYAPEVHLAFGKLLLEAGDTGRALVEFSMESRIRPASADAHFHTGSILLSQNKPKEALAELNRADELSPNSPLILLAVGRAATAAGDSARAESAFRKVAASAADDGVVKIAQDELDKLKR